MRMLNGGFALVSVICVARRMGRFGYALLHLGIAMHQLVHNGIRIYAILRLFHIIQTICNNRNVEGAKLMMVEIRGFPSLIQQEIFREVQELEEDL